MPRQYFVYILTNKNNKVLYTGVTNDLSRRVWEHKEKLVDGFSKKYNLTKLVYCEETDKIEDAIAREKQIKGWLRKKKNILIESINPGWKDLLEEPKRDSSQKRLRMTDYFIKLR
ncbi:MAG: GIY-YIG nuclease family protein [Candidatus Omnitrophota bacterium]